MDAMPVKLQRYIIREMTRHKRWVYYFRKGKGPRIRLPDYGDPDFDEAYNAALLGNQPRPKKAANPSHTIGWLIDRYKESREWASYSDATRKMRDFIFREVITNSKNAAFSHFTRTTIEKGMKARMDKPAQANSVLNAMRKLFAWAQKNGHVEINPCDGVGKTAYKSDGFPAWNEDDARKFCAKWPVGTMPRLAFELICYSGLRRSDIVRVGRQHLKGNVLTIRTAKTGIVVSAELPQALMKTIDATKTGDLTFVVGETGRPLNRTTFGKMFRLWAREAGVKKSAHGVRKLSATTAANAGATAHELMSQFGWTTTQMAEIYTRGADRAKLGVASSRRIAEQMESIIPRTSDNGAGKIRKSKAKTKAE